MTDLTIALLIGGFVGMSIAFTGILSVEIPEAIARKRKRKLTVTIPKDDLYYFDRDFDFEFKNQKHLDLFEMGRNVGQSETSHDREKAFQAHLKNITLK